MTDRPLPFSLAVVEGFHLAELIDQLTSVLADSDAGSDPAVERLVPQAYRDDAEASAEFAYATRTDLLERRRADAVSVRSALAPLLITSPEDLDEDDGIEERDVPIPAEDLDAWLRTLTTLRLVIATRLDLTAADDEHDPEDPRFHVYDWLGYRLDGLVALADARDDELT